MNKRFQKEIRQLYIQQSNRNLLDNDYLIFYNEEDINCLSAIIKGPCDSVYRHKFIRLDFKIPPNYPHSPPEVTFVNYDGVRIHPNMYENGKCCATILNTWGDDKFEKWTSSMGIETILLTFHSFLDNNPYTYEPGGRDDSSYTVYVQHQTWISCLIRYLQNENISLFVEFINVYLLTNIDSIFNDLQQLAEMYQIGYYETRCFEIDNYSINYSKISTVLQYYYNYMDLEESQQHNYSFSEFLNTSTGRNPDTDYNCCICYDSGDQNLENQHYKNLECNHRFHKECLKNHIINNNNICPMCRKPLTESEVNELQEAEMNAGWMINPLTKRKIKIGGRTYNYLVNNGDINVSENN